MSKRAKKVAAWAPPAATRALMLRTCGEGMKAHGGFVWPRSGYVEAPDWQPSAKCGKGLHGLLWGAGNASLLQADAADWLVVEIDAAEAIDLSGKVKVQRGNVLFTGSRVDAVALIQAQAPVGTAVVYGTSTAGDYGTATAGYAGTATAGEAGTATAGEAGTATAGTRGTATAGDYGTATAGYAGTATAGEAGTATAGDAGTATAGDAGTATAGARGTATAGYAGTATAGLYGVVAIEWYDGTSFRKAIAEVDGETIKAGAKYRINGGKFVPA